MPVDEIQLARDVEHDHLVARRGRHGHVRDFDPALAPRDFADANLGGRCRVEDAGIADLFSHWRQEKEILGAGRQLHDLEVERWFGRGTLTTQDTDQEHGSAPYKPAARAGGHMNTTSKRAQGGLTVPTTLSGSQMGPVMTLTGFWIAL